ncbi:MAG: dTMP kinase [candidate division Zixibacteria bacterium]|nr:dTMP kinase [candidate division Zixibacteria bacterium]MDH3937461.1 dTMP kinase [candidate division Zixibacteria bacterium]MDH4032528.1 dTMP kinase [candidate division Zixibacteria bacterium]
MSARKQKALFLTFEGIDGCGKTTQAMMAYQYLKSHGYRVKLLREPGSTATAERIRDLLLDKEGLVAPVTELFLYEAARAELCHREIRPLLASGYTVLCDRFYDSTTAYQGYGRKLDIRMVRSINRFAVGDLKPDLTFLLDLDLRTALSRRTGRPDRLESQSKAFFTRVRAGFLELARKERPRVKVIDARQTVDQVFRSITKILDRRINR